MQIESPSPALPVRVPCPLCGQELIVYLDIHGGGWFHCPSCQQAGDMIELAAKTWKLDTLTTLRKLAARGVKLPPSMLEPLNVERYETNILQTRGRLDKFMDESSRRPFQDNEEYAYLHDQFGMASHLDPDRWRAQMGRFLGWSDRIAAEIAFRPGSKGMGTRGIRGRDRIFQGSYWKEVMAIYFKVLPGRLSGVWFAGRDGKFPKDWVFRWSISGYSKLEAGLGFYDAVLEQNSQFGNTAFAVLDPILAIRLHSKWFKDNGTPLPLVLAYESLKCKSNQVWGRLPPRDWVFWGMVPTPELFSQAAMVNGKIYIGKADSKDLAHHKILLQRIADKARRWDRVLEDELPRLTDQQVQRIIHNLPMTRQQWEDVIRLRKKKEVRQRLRYLSDLDYPVKKVSLSNTNQPNSRFEVTETPHGWFVNGNLISEVMLRVDTAFVRDGKYRHKVRVKFRDRIISIRMTNKEVRYNIAEKIERALVKVHIGVPIIDKGWAPRLYEIAKLFSRPKVFNEKLPLEDTTEFKRKYAKPRKSRSSPENPPRRTDPTETSQSDQSRPSSADQSSTDPQPVKS